MMRNRFVKRNKIPGVHIIGDKDNERHFRSSGTGQVSEKSGDVKGDPDEGELNSNDKDGDPDDKDGDPNGKDDDPNDKDDDPDDLERELNGLDYLPDRIFYLLREVILSRNFNKKPINNWRKQKNNGKSRYQNC